MVVVLIGTNNLPGGAGSSSIADGVKKLVEAIISESGASDVLVLPLLPRGSGFQPRVAEVNERLRAHFASPAPPTDGSTAVASKSSQIFEARIHVSRCEATLVTEESRGLEESLWVANENLMPDQLHPGGAGVAVWLSCLKNEIDAALALAKAQ